MQPGTYDFTLRKGDTFSDVWTVYQPCGTVLNLTGYTARLFIRVAADAPATLLELTTTNNRITLGGTAGTVTLSASDTLTGALPEGDCVYDLELTAPSGTVTTWVAGTITVVPKVTR